MSIVSRTVRRTTVVTALTCSLLASTGGFAIAEDGTGAATPAAVSTCTIVEAKSSRSSAATPKASPAASPMASPATKTSSPLDADISDAAHAITGCLSEADYATIAKITSDDWRGQLIGMDGPVNGDDFVTFAKNLPKIRYTVKSVSNVTAKGADSATADVTYTVGQHLRSGTWTFALKDVDGKKVWTLASDAPAAAPVPSGAQKADVKLEDGKITVSKATFKSGDLAIHATNAGTTQHEVLIIKLGGKATTDTLLNYTGSGLPDGISFVGQATLAPASDGTIVLTGLTPGTYAIVDMLPGANGLPNLSGGMKAEFKVG